MKAKHIPNTKASILQAEVRAVLKPGSRIYTDALPSYVGLGKDYIHETVDHACEYVRGAVHTNGLENFWSLFKLAIKGTYVSIEPFHLNAYVVEETFRFNERKANDGGRFRALLRSVDGKRITYRELTGHRPTAAA